MAKELFKQEKKIIVKKDNFRLSDMNVSRFGVGDDDSLDVNHVRILASDTEFLRELNTLSTQIAIKKIAEAKANEPIYKKIFQLLLM